MSGRHLDLEALVDVAEGTRPVPVHAETCDACRQQLADLRSARAAVADVDVPEPSPLFWDHLSARVREAVSAEPPPRSGFWEAWSWRPAIAVAAVVAVAGLAVAFGVSRSRPGDAAIEAARTTAVEPGDPGDPGEIDAAPLLELTDASDPSLDLIADLSEGLDWDAATAAGWTTATGSLDHVFDQLNEAERATLQQVLHEALSGTGA